MASEIQLKGHLFGQEPNLFTEKVGFSANQLGLSFQKALIFLRKLFFPLKIGFPGKRCNFYLKKEVQCAKNLKE